MKRAWAVQEALERDVTACDDGVRLMSRSSLGCCVVCSSGCGDYVYSPGPQAPATDNFKLSRETKELSAGPR